MLAVLRADDLEAAVREAEAAFAQLQQSTRPQAEAALREAAASLLQASREVTRRRDLLKRQLIAHETLEQAVQVETVARTAAEQARLAARSLAAGNPNEAAARAREMCIRDRSFGLDPLQSGLITFASAAGAMFMKTLAARILRRFGFRPVLIANALAASVLLCAFGLFRADTPYPLLIGVLLASGCFRSLQFTSLNAITYADIEPESMGQALSLIHI